MISDKTKRIKIALIIIIVIVVAGLFLIGLNCSNLSSNDLNLKLERSVSELVEKDKSVRNCVLVVTREMVPTFGRAQPESPLKTVRCL